MNIQQLKDRFEERANLFPEIETFIFDDLSVINVYRNKTYPVCLMKIPQGITTPFLTNDIEPLYENQTITFYIFKIFDSEIKKTVPLEQIYREIETIGDGYLRDVLHVAGNEYSLIADKSVTKNRGHLHQVAVDPVIAVSWTFTLRVFNSLCGELVKPTNLTVTTVSNSALDLVWVDNSTTESGYEVYRSLNTVGFAKITTLPADSTAFSDTGLVINTVYYYRIKVVDLNGGGVFSDIVAGMTLSVPQFGIAYARPILTGQTTSFRTNDDASHLSSGTYDYTSPSFPVSFAKLDTTALSPFETLIFDNSFGNKSRFTDDLGGQTYTSDLAIDHLTGLMWFIVPQGTANWDGSVDGAAASTQGGFSDWRLSNMKEMESIINFDVGDTLNYVPFSNDRLGTNVSHWTSTVDIDSSGSRKFSFRSRNIIGQSYNILRDTSATTLNYYQVRNFFN